MHKKVIRGVIYYYTTVRENGRIKTIYLGRTRDEARKREAELKDIELKSFPKTWAYFGLVVLIIIALFLGGAIVGYLVSVSEPTGVMGKLSVEVTFQAGDFLPRDAVIEVLLENQTSNITLKEFLKKSGSELLLEEDNFYSSEIELAGSGEGYGVRGTKETYPYVGFEFNLIAYNESASESEIFNGSCSFENPYLTNASDLIYQLNANYSVVLVPGSVRIDNKTLDDSYVSLELREDLVLAETSYSEILEGYGSGFTGENRTFILNLSELGIETPEVPGTYTVITRVIYNGSVLEETSRKVTLVTEAPEAAEVCTDNDKDGYDTCEPNKDCDDTNPNIYPGAEEICGNLIDEDCDGYDEACSIKLSDVIESNNITYVRKEVVDEFSRKKQARVIIKLKDVSKKSDIEKEITPGREVKNFISSVVDEQEMINIVNKFTEDDIELIQIDHPIRLVMDDVVNQTGVRKVWDLNVTGKDQTVCVVDSGIDYNHTNLSGNYLEGYDFVNNDSDPMDDYGHGTYVSGIVTGAAKDSKILMVKVFGNDGIGYESDILAGIDYCVQNKDTYNISVMLMSFGGWIYNTSCYCDSNLVANESNFAVSQGIFAVAASGNDGEAYLKAPACGTNVTSVGAVDKNDNVASFTNIEPLLDLLAPGVEIESTKLGGGFETKNGTSASAAVVAGVASLILENESLTPLDLQYRLRSTGFVIIHNGTGYTRVDAYSAIINNVTNTPSSQEGQQCEGTWEEYEPLAVVCESECDGSCQVNCVRSGCGGGSMPGCAACDCQINCAEGLCGAACGVDGDCSSYCVGEVRYHTGVCNTACNECSCSYSTTDCTTLCYNTCTEKHCASNNCDNQGASCGVYKCSTGTGCTSTCEKDCGAACESASDCSSDGCYGGCPGCEYRDYFCTSSCNCDYNPYNPDSTSGRCSSCMGSGYWQIGGEASQGTDYCCGDDTSEYRITETGGTDAPSGYNNAITTCCNPSTDCTYDDACTATGGTSAPAIPNKAYCGASSTWYGGDAGSTQCNAIAGSGNWAVGGSGDCTGGSCLAGCCGDDNGEEHENCIKTSAVSWSCLSTDDTCCDVSTDCVDPGDDSCKTQGSAYDVSGSPSADNYAFCNSTGGWEDCDDSNEVNCGGTYCTGGSITCGETFGECVLSENDCCGDDSGENYETCTAGTGFPDAGTCTSADEACCDNTNDCVNTDGTVCTTSTTHATDGDGDTDDDYCLSGTWYDCFNDGDCGVGDVCQSNECQAAAPTIVLNSPDNAIQTNSFSITFNATVWNDFNGINNVSLYGNWSTGWHNNETNTSGINETDYIFNKDLSGPGDGYYIWGIKACATNGLCSESENRTFLVDTTAPTPTPAQMSSVVTDSASQITATATTASDGSGVGGIEYKINETTGNSGSSNSSWQGTTTHVDNGLSSNTQYCYKSQYRDSLGNTGTASSNSCNYTYAAAPTIVNVECGGGSPNFWCNVTFSMGSNPAGTEHYIEETSGNTGGSSQDWTSSTDTYNDTGLVDKTEYCYKIRARNGNNVNTSFSSEACRNTAELDITETLDPDVTEPSTTVYVTGHVELGNGTDAVDNPLNIWLNGSLLTMQNLTAHGTYDNDKSFTHTSSGDWDGGTFANTTYDSENVTLNDTEIDPDSNTVALFHFSGNEGVELPAGTGMKGLWHLNNNDLSDSSGEGNDGTAMGGLNCAGDEGVFDEGCEFDGSDDFINITSDLGDPSGITLMLWFKKPNVNQGSQYLLDGRAGGNWWFLQDYTSGVCTDTNGNICYHSRVEVKSGNLSNNEWHHVAVTDNSSESRIYFNGELMDTGTGQDPDLGAGFRIGTRYTDSAFFNGSMDEVVVYNRTLSASEILEIYQRGRANDSSTNDNDGQISGPVQTTGKIGKALDFDASNDWVSVSDSSSLKLNSTGTIAFWYKADSWRDVYTSIIQKGTGAGWAESSNEAFTIFNHFNSNYIAFSIGNGTTHQYTQISPRPTSGVWHHYVFTFNETTLASYWNGQLNDTSPRTLDINQADLPIWIGKSLSGTVDGAIDEVAIYNRTLSASEVSGIYQNQICGYYHCEGTFESEIVDANAIVEWKNISWTEPYEYGEEADPNSDTKAFFHFSGNEGVELPAGTGMKGLWHLNDNDLSDSSGEGNDGTAGGGLVCTGDHGVFDEGCDLDGTDDHIEVDTTSIKNVFAAGSNFTVAMWLYPGEDPGGSWQWAFCKAYTSHDSPYYQVDIRYQATASEGYVYGRTWNTGASTHLDASSSAGTVPLNEWTYVVMTVDLTNTELKLYINGNFSAEDTTSSGTYSNYDTAVGFGEDLNLPSTTYNFNGSIDELAIWNRTLSDSEIADLYNRGRANDSTTNDNDGQIAGAVQTTGKIGKALDFDGSNDYVNCGDDTSLRLGKNQTVAAWVKIDGYTGWARVVGKGEDSTNRNYGLWYDSDGDALFQIYDGLGGSCNAWISGSSGIDDLSLDTWYFVVGVYNGTKISLYVNGELAYNTSCTITPANNADPLIIGRYPGTFVNGTIDEVAIHNRSLSASEIYDLYIRGLELKFQARSCDDSGCSGESFLGPDGTGSTYFTDSSGGALSVSDNRYLQYKAFLETLSGIDTPYVQEVVVNYTGVVTDSSGDYNYSFSAPSSEGTYPVKVNTTYFGIYGDNSKNLTVSDYIVDGGSETTCDATNKCLFIQNSTGSVKARLDQFGYVDVKGGYSYDQSSLSPPPGSFTINNSTGDVKLYIDGNGNLTTSGNFYKQLSPSPSGGDDLIVNNSTGDVVGYIDGGTGNMYFKEKLHYNSNF